MPSPPCWPSFVWPGKGNCCWNWWRYGQRFCCCWYTVGGMKMECCWLDDSPKNAIRMGRRASGCLASSCTICCARIMPIAQFCILSSLYSADWLLKRESKWCDWAGENATNCKFFRQIPENGQDGLGNEWTEAWELATIFPPICLCIYSIFIGFYCWNWSMTQRKKSRPALSFLDSPFP